MMSILQHQMVIQLKWKKDYIPSQAEIKSAALLADQGYITSLTHMTILNRNIIVIPHLPSLASKVIGEVIIDKIIGQSEGVLRDILERLKCASLDIRNLFLVNR